MIYLLECTDYYKIGFTKDLNKRMKDYNTHNPDFVLLDSFDADRIVETRLHNLCKLYKYQREWFYKDPFVLHMWNIEKNNFIKHENINN